MNDRMTNDPRIIPPLSEEVREGDEKAVGELIDYLSRRDVSSYGRLTVAKTAFAEARAASAREALEWAVKAMCPLCRAGEAIGVNGREQVVHTSDEPEVGGAYADCAAQEIILALEDHDRAVQEGRDD